MVRVHDVKPVVMAARLAGDRPMGESGLRAEKASVGRSVKIGEGAA